MAYTHVDLFPLGEDKTPYRSLGSDGVSVETVGGREVLSVSREAIKRLSEQAFIDINHLLRPGISQQLAKILDDPEATANDRFVAYRPAEEREHRRAACCRCARTPARDRLRQEGPRVWTDGDEDEAPSPMASRRPTQAQPALLAGRAALDVRGEEHRAPTCRRRSTSMPRARTPTSSCSSPRAAARPTRPSCSRRRPRADQGPAAGLPEGEDPDARHGGLPALSPRRSSSAAPRPSMTLKTVKLASTKWLDALPTKGAKSGACLPRPRNGGGDP
jgi:fumarate hydratase class I